MITVHILWVRERTGEKRLPWSPGDTHPRNRQIQVESWRLLLKGTFAGLSAGRSLLYLPVLFARGMGYGFFIVVVPLLAAQHAGWTEDRIGALNGTAQLVAGAAAVLFGGWLAEKAGAQRMALACYGLISAILGAMLFARDLWGDDGALTAFVYSWMVVYTFLLIALMVIAMRFTVLQVSATQFSIYMAVHNLGISFAGLVIGSIEASGGMTGLFAALIATQVVAIALLIFVRFPDGKAVSAGVPPARD